MGERAGAFGAVFGNPALRRLESAWAGSIVGTWSYSIAISVFAFRHGGAAAVGTVTVIRWIPAAFAAPWMSVLGDRLPRRRVMLAADIARAGAMAAMAATALGGGPRTVIYLLAACSAVSGTAFGPAQSALLPSLARTPEELTAANVVSTTIESFGIFGGPALGGLLLAATSPGVVFAAAAGTFVWSALNIARLPDDPRVPAPRASVLDEALAGIRTIATQGRARLLLALFAAQTLVDGALGVLVVVLALKRLHIGAAGVGFLNAAAGIGGLAGALLATFLIGRRRLARDFGAGILLWGVPIALIGVWPNEWAALLLLALVGAANTVVDVAGMTLLQRSVSDHVLARVFGVLDSLILGSAGLGAVLAPLLYRVLGLRGALLVVGAVLPAAALLGGRALAAIDRAVSAPAHLERLRGVPFLAVLPVPALELLAGRLSQVRVAAGNNVFAEGDRGDRFYVIDSGEVEILGARHGPGGYFGEIALLRDVPRTATVHAVSDVELVALERDDFIGAVTGHAPSAEAAESVIGARLPSLSG
jgi:MFS family permease